MYKCIHYEVARMIIKTSYTRKASCDAQTQTVGIFMARCAQEIEDSNIFHTFIYCYRLYQDTTFSEMQGWDNEVR